MPHVHSMTIFGVDRISIKFVPELNSYSIALIEGTDDEKTVISIWRSPNGGERPDLLIEGLSFAPKETNDALDTHSEESDR
jgi:hypothetical protein